MEGLHMGSTRPAGLYGLSAIARLTTSAHNALTTSAHNTLTTSADIARCSSGGGGGLVDLALLAVASAIAP